MANRPTLQAVLSEYMEQRGFSQADLVRASGLPKPTVSRWLSGRTVNPYDHDGLLRAARALKLAKAQANRLLRAVNGPTIDALLAAPRDDQQRELLEPWRAAAATRTNLPAELTSFVGREGELGQLTELLCEGRTRLLTLTGPGGSGKTRLALRVAADLLDVFPDGVFFVSLAALTDPEAAPAAIARALELREVPGVVAVDRLADWLRPRRVLLLLDNLEHLIGAGSAIVGLLRAAPGLAILVTSRAPLHISGEQEWPVSPLPLPGSDRRRASLLANPAVALFLQRAQAVRPRLDLAGDREQLRAVAEVCARLDGLPLAIELAAARIRDAEPDRLLTRFPSRLDLAGDGPRDAERRQQTLRDTIAWSFDLLPPAARIVLRRLAVFPGGIDQQAAVAVCSSEGVPPETVTYALGALLDAHLLEPLGAAGSGARSRYRMLETIREYAQERLAESGEEPALRERHGRWYLKLAESAPPYFPETRTGANDWFARVDEEQDNLRAALAWLESRAEHERLARLAAALWPYWHEYWYVAEGRRWLDAVLSHTEALPAKLRAALLTGACVMAFNQGDFQCGAPLNAAALTLTRQLGDHHGQAIVLQQQAWSAYSQGDVARAVPLFEATLDAWRAVGDPRGIARGLSDLALALYTSGQFDAALPYLNEAEERYRSTGDDLGLARSLTDRGLHALLRGDVPAAIPLLGEAVDRLRQLGRTYSLPAALFYLGTARCLAGQLDQALAHLAEALRLREEEGDKLGISLVLLGFAAVAHRQGEGRRAAILCGASQSLQQSTGIGLAPAVQAFYEREVALVIEQIGPDAFATTFADGRHLTLSEAISLARNSTVTAKWSVV